MGRAGACDVTVHPILVAVIVAVGGFGLDRRYRHVLSTVSTFQEPGEYLDRLILHGPTPIGPLFLNLPEHILVYDGRVSSLHLKPCFRRIVRPLFILERYRALPIVDAVSKVRFIFQNITDGTD